MSRRRPTGRLPHRRLQTILAIAAVATAVALPVTLLSVGGGVVSHELSDLEQQGFQVTVSAAGVHGIDESHALSTQFDRVPNVAASSPVLSAAIDLFVGGAGPAPLLAEGILPGAFLATAPPSQRSLLPSPLPLGDPTDSIHFANGTYAGPATNDLLLSSPLARSDGIAVGDTVGLAGGPNASNAVPFTVTGLFGTGPAFLGPTAADAALLPLSDLQLLTGTALVHGELVDGSDTIEVALAGTASVQPGSVTAVANAVQAIVPYYGVTSLVQQADELRSSAAILTGFYIALSSVSLTVGLLFLAIILVRRVESDRGLIAVRRAIGVPRRQIAGEMLGRGAALGLAGGIGGIAGGIVVVEILARWGSATVAEIAGLAVFDPLTLGILLLAVVGLTVPAGGLATRAALRLSIPEALR